MLLKFSAKNYKAFRDGFELSMRPTAIKDLKESVLVDEDKNVKGLSSIVIYGPNASGKTSVLRAINDFQLLIRNGGFSKNDNNDNKMENAMLSLIPFVYDNEPKPIEFEVEFLNDDDKRIYFGGSQYEGNAWFWSEIYRSRCFFISVVCDEVVHIDFSRSISVLEHSCFSEYEFACFKSNRFLSGSISTCYAVPLLSG